jgi:hypothetical protein
MTLTCKAVVYGATAVGLSLVVLAFSACSYGPEGEQDRIQRIKERSGVGLDGIEYERTIEYYERSPVPGGDLPDDAGDPEDDSVTLIDGDGRLIALPVCRAKAAESGGCEYVKLGPCDSDGEWNQYCLVGESTLGTYLNLRPGIPPSAGGGRDDDGVPGFGPVPPDAYTDNTEEAISCRAAIIDVQFDITSYTAAMSIPVKCFAAQIPDNMLGGVVIQRPSGESLSWVDHIATYGDTVPVDSVIHFAGDVSDVLVDAWRFGIRRLEFTTITGQVVEVLTGTIRKTGLPVAAVLVDGEVVAARVVAKAD